MESKTKINEYEILLSYLKNEENKSKNLESIKSFEDIETDKSIKNETNPNGGYQDNKNLDTPIFSNKSTVGFDVDKFENLMRSRLIDNHKKLQSYDRPYISVTELFSCIRKAYYTRMKYDIDLKKQFNFSYLDIINEIGNLIHSYIQKLYIFSEIEKTIISEKYKVKGRIDAINDNFLYEFKTLDEKKFKGIYLKEHYYQANIYAFILNSEYDYKINTVTLVYFFRDNIKRKPYTIDLKIDENLAKKFLENSEILLNCISNKKVPEPINSDKDQCFWCSYKSYCQNDSSKIRKPFDTKYESKENEIDFDLNNKNDNKKETVFLL